MKNRLLIIIEPQAHKKLNPSLIEVDALLVNKGKLQEEIGCVYLLHSGLNRIWCISG